MAYEIIRSRLKSRGARDATCPLTNYLYGVIDTCFSTLDTVIHFVIAARLMAKDDGGRREPAMDESGVNGREGGVGGKEGAGTQLHSVTI